jgi:short-subunit dehydrogenase
VIALVTGASSGIGETTARRLAREPGATLVLVARREERLKALAAALPRASYVAVDLTSEDAPARVREHLEAEHGGRLDLLVNNAGGAWRGKFGDAGWENVRKTMELDFDAVVRLTEALLPLLRASAPASIVNVASVAGRVGRAGSGAYSAAKFALVGWSESLALEEREHGVHVGVVLPGFIRTEGFPAKELPQLIVSTPEKVADAIVRAGPGGKPEVYVPRWWAAVPRLRFLAPGLVRRVSGSGAVAPPTAADRQP